MSISVTGAPVFLQMFLRNWVYKPPVVSKSMWPLRLSSDFIPTSEVGNLKHCVLSELIEVELCPLWAHQEWSCHSRLHLSLLKPTGWQWGFSGEPRLLPVQSSHCGQSTLQPFKDVSTQPIPVLSLACLLKAKFQLPVPKCTSRCVGLRCAEKWRAPSVLVSLCSACCKPAAVLSISLQFSSVQLLSRVRPFATHGLQHTRPPCPSPTPRVYSNLCPLSWWCHPTISSFVVPFSSCLQSFPATIILRCSLSVPVDLLFYSSLPGVQVPFRFLFSFVLPGYVVILLVILALWDLPAFSKYSVRIVLHGDVFLMYLWGEIGSMSFYSTILIWSLSSDICDGSHYFF